LTAKSRTAIVVDSAASLPEATLGQQGLYIAPMSLTLGDGSYLDRRDITPTEFYRLLRESDSLPTTSAPAPASFLDAFRQAAQGDESVLCLTLASRFSASADSARTAAQEAASELPGIEIRVLDTESAAGGEGLVAMEAWRAAQRGESLDEVEAAARMVVSRVRLLAFLDTLYYLWKGGRVPQIAHLGASLLRLKPVFELVRGEVHTLSRPRTRQRAMRRLVELMHERTSPGPVHATIMHADSAKNAEEIRQRVEAEFDCRELFISEFTPAMGAHIGPGLLGIAFWNE
jgi:DegV family protein with EDD domain